MSGWVSILSVIVVFGLSGCTKSEKEKSRERYQRDRAKLRKEYVEPRLPPGLGSKEILPKSFDGFEIQKILKNEKIREVADSKVVGLTSGAAVNRDGVIYFVGKYNHLFEEDRKVVPGRVTKANITHKNPFFAWNPKTDDLKLIADDLEFYDPNHVMFSPGLKGCPKGDPIIFGVASLGGIELPTRDGGVNRVPGAPEIRADCFSKCGEKFCKKEIYKKLFPYKQIIGDIFSNEKGEFFMTSQGFEPLESSEKGKYEVSFQKYIFRVDQIDVENNKIIPLLKVVQTEGEESELIPARSVSVFKTGDLVEAIGLSQDNESFAYCSGKKKSKDKAAKTSCHVVSGGKFVLDFDGSDFKKGYIRWGTTYFTESDKKSVVFMGQVWHCDITKRKTRWKCKGAPTKITAPLYGAIKVLRYGNHLYVFDFIEQSNLGNSIYQLNYRI